MMEWMYSEESLRGQFRAGHVWFVVSADGEPCGYVSVERQGGRLFHLHKIYVLPRFQGIGAGALLFRSAVAYVRSVCPEPCRMELNLSLIHILFVTGFSTRKSDCNEKSVFALYFRILNTRFLGKPIGAKI